MNNTVGRFHPATHNAAVFSDSLSNDILISCRTDTQKVLLGFGCNVPSTVSFANNRVAIGNETTSVNTQIYGDMSVEKDCYMKAYAYASNMYIYKQLGVGTTNPNSNYQLYVSGDTRIEGTLTINGNIYTVDTNVSSTDQFLVDNDGTAPALVARQRGAHPIAYFYDDTTLVFQVVDGGNVAIGPEVPLEKLDVQGNMLVRGDMSSSNITSSNIFCSNIFVNSNISVDHKISTDMLYAGSVYMGNNLVLTSTGVTNSNYIPHLNTSNIVAGTFTSNFIRDREIIGSKISCNVQLDGNVFVNGALAIADTTNPSISQYTRLHVGNGDVTVAGRNNFASIGDQARVNLGDTRYFIGGVSNVGIVMQVPGTTYPLLLANGTGFVGLGKMDPEEELHVAKNTKVDGAVYASSIAIGHSNTSEPLSVLGSMSMSNLTGKVVMYTSGKCTGINITNPVAGLHVQQYGTSDGFRIENSVFPFSVKQDGKVGVGTLSPISELDIQGSVRTKQVFSIDGGGRMELRDASKTGFDNGHWVVGNSNIATNNCVILYKVGADGSTNPDNSVVISENGFMKIGGGSMADERMHVSHGHAKFDSNVYVMRLLGVGLSNPTEAMDVYANVKSSNVFVKNRLGVATSNPAYTVDIQGDLNISGRLYAGGTNISGWTTSSNGVYYLSNVSIGGSTSDELFQIQNGNAKFMSNVYILQKLAVGKSNPTDTLDVNGTVKASGSVRANAAAMYTLDYGSCNLQATFSHSNYYQDFSAYALRQDMFGGTYMNAPISLNLCLQDQVLASFSNGVMNVTSDMYAKKLGMNVTQITETLDVGGNFKARSNVYFLKNLAIAHSNPTEALDVLGNLKASSNAYVLNSIGIRTSNPKEALDITGNAKLSQSMYILQNAAIGHSNPTESMDLLGNLKTSSNIYALGKLAVAFSNPTEVVDINGHGKMRSNLYVLNGVTIGHSNLTEKLDIQGNVKVVGKMYAMSNISIAKSNVTEAFDMDGNAKVGSNLYVMSNLGVRTSNPTEVVDISGNMKVSQYSYVMTGLGVGTSNATQALTVAGNAYVYSNITTESNMMVGNRASFGKLADPMEAVDVHGNVKSDNRVYAMVGMGVGTSNPTEVLQVVGNTKVTQSLYSLITIGIATSNTTEALDAIGNAKISSNLYVLNRLGVGSSNPSEAMDVTGNVKASSKVFAMQAVGIATSNTTEKLDISGNVKSSSNAYVMNAVSVAHSNPTEAVDVQGNIKLTGNVYSMNKISVANSNPTEAADIWGNVKVSSNVYAMQKLGVGTSNATEAAHIVGNARVTGNVYSMTKLGVGTATPSEAADIWGACKVQSNLYVMSNVAIGFSNPAEMLDVNGSVRIRSNLYTSNNIGVNTLSPSEKIHVDGNVKVTSNVYALQKLGVGKSNPTYPVDVSGDVNYSGKLYSTGAEVVPWKTSGTNIYYDQAVSVGTSAFDEKFNVNVGNAKFTNNAYVMGRLGIGTTTPSQSLEVVGNIKATNGTHGPMIMLIPPVAYADISVNNRLVLDNTIEAGNDIADSTYKPLFSTAGFLSQDLSGESMTWTEARIIFRGMALTSTAETTTMSVQEYIYSRTPQYADITSTFNIQTTSQNAGYVTSSTPWFSMTSTGVRHLAIYISNSTTANAVYRFGSVYLQFR